MIFLTPLEKGTQHETLPWKCFASTHLAFARNIEHGVEQQDF